MYLRHTTRRKDGKTHGYWQLVRSVRRGRKVVQETVAQLGELDAEGRARAAVLARKISGRAQAQGKLFEPTTSIAAAAVRLDAVRLERSRSFGAVWLSWVLWQALQFDALLNGMEARFGKVNRVWVMDRGMVSAENLAWLNQTGRRYVIGTPKARLRRWASQIAEETDWRHIREDVEVKVCRGPAGLETFLLCRSASRVDKERAMHERFGQHIEDGLARLGRRIERSKQPLERGLLERQIGRLLQRNSRAAGGFAITISADDTHPAEVKLTWQHRPEWQDWARLSEGVYILRTNIAQWSDEELWQTYIQLTEAEAAFRIHKSELAIRPIWHHKQERLKAHILLCFIAYALRKTLQQWQSRAAGLGHAPRTILEEFSRIHAADIVLPPVDTKKPQLRIRCVVRPNREQAILLEHLGLKLPERLRSPHTPQM